ncbi:MAG: hypothetical protein ABJA02_13580 [Acidobacteriota bacterium]
MKTVGENAALGRLKEINSSFRSEIAEYERAAQDCSSCLTPGACCLDEHFVNVRISRLEAVAIGITLSKLPLKQQVTITERIDAAISRYSLDAEAQYSRSFACPLYEKGIGCLVHVEGKPLPCIQHACYEKAADLPPDERLDAAEARVDALNHRVYRSPQPFLPLPVAIKHFGRSA